MPNPVTGTLADHKITVSHLLRLKAANLAFTLYGKGIVSPDQAEAQVGVDPDPWWLPDVEAGTARTQAGEQQDISFGYGDSLRFKTGERSGGGGKTTFDQLTGGIGPFRAYYEKGRGEGPFDPKTKTHGATLDLPLWDEGRWWLEGEQQETTNPWVKARGLRGGVGAEYPFGDGKFHGGLEHRRMDLDVPGQEVSVPSETLANIGWTGELGPMQLGAGFQYGIPSDLWKAGVFGRVKF